VLRDVEHVEQRLDVVDHGRLAEQAGLHRERRLVARLAAVALDRVEERRLLAADVGARAAAQLHVEADPLAEHVLAEQPPRSRLRDRVRDPFGRQRVFAPDVDEPELAPGREAGDRHRLEQRERVLFHQHAILERAGLRLVGVAHEIVGPDRIGSDGRPLAPGGERRATAADEL
jgi:hypothetical protein